MSNNLLHPSDAIASKVYDPLDEDPDVPEITKEGFLTVNQKDCFAFGTFAEVLRGFYRCEGSEQIQEVAVKALRLQGMTQAAPADYNKNLTRIDKRLVREIYTWKRLKHERITPLLGYALSESNIVGNNRPILVSPYRKNSNLRVYIDLNPNADKLSLIRNVCEGLAYLHNFDPRIVHLDLKPHNILVKDNGEAELCDFGLSKTLEDARTGLTTSGNVAMSLGYAAPEVLDADDASALRKMTKPDIYSLGCVMVETFSGVPPWGVRPNAAKVIRMVSGGETPSREAHPILGYPEATVDTLWELMLRCWAMDPHARPKAEAVKASLIQIQQMSELPADPTS